MSALGTARVKPTAQLMGAFLAACQQLLGDCTPPQLVAMLSALGELKLVPSDTQVRHRGLLIDLVLHGCIGGSAGNECVYT